MTRIDEILCEPENTKEAPFGRIKPGAYMKLTGKVKKAITRPLDCEY